MNSLPTINPQSYQGQQENNNEQALGMFTLLFPDLTIDPTHIYTILTFLEQTQVNPEILPQVIRGVNNLLIGTGKGQVIIHVQGHRTNIEVRETSPVVDSVL